MLPARGVSIGARLVWTLGLIGVVLILYGVAAMLGAAPLPRSARSLAQAHGVGHGYTITSGYYVIPPGFVSIGSALPPYTLAERVDAGSPSVRVSPKLEDVRSGKVTALVDLATGDGSKWSPYYVRTLGSAGAVTSAIGVGMLLVVAFLFWIAGFVATAVAGSRRPRAQGVPRATL